MEKINQDIPLTISYDEMKEIAKKVLNSQHNWSFEYSDKYWLITIAPSGEILYPDKGITGHPAMAEEMVYPNDKMLQMMYDYLMPDYYRNNEIVKSYFMILYGYINIDGYTENIKRMQCKYNPLALTVHTRALPQSIKDFCEMISSIDEEHMDKEAMGLANKVPFFKRKILELLQISQLKETEIEKLIEKRGQTAKEFFDGLNRNFEDVIFKREGR